MPEAALPPLLRRVIVAEAHRLRTGACPRLLHSLGTGESFGIAPLEDGFLDEESGQRARREGAVLRLPAGVVAVALDDDVAFSGTAGDMRFTGRAGGGASVTVYLGAAYWQYAVVA